MSAEDASNSLVCLGFDVINGKQTTANRRAPHGQAYVETLLLFIVKFQGTLKSQVIFKLNNLNHIVIKVEPYRVQTGLTQCYNCLNFVHVWANCKQPLDVCGGHLPRECPEKTNAESTPSCCSCTPVEGEKPHPAPYRGCSHAKGEGHNELPRDPLGGRSSLSSPHQSSPKQLHCDKTCNAGVVYPFSTVFHFIREDSTKSIHNKVNNIRTLNSSQKRCSGSILRKKLITKQRRA
jgi:hypothetical protein